MASTTLCNLAAHPIYLLRFSFDLQPSNLAKLPSSGLAYTLATTTHHPNLTLQLLIEQIATELAIFWTPFTKVCLPTSPSLLHYGISIDLPLSRQAPGLTLVTHSAILTPLFPHSVAHHHRRAPPHTSVLPVLEGENPGGGRENIPNPIQKFGKS